LHDGDDDDDGDDEAMATMRTSTTTAASTTTDNVAGRIASALLQNDGKRRGLCPTRALPFLKSGRAASYLQI